MDENAIKSKKDSKATAGFVLGLISIIAWFIPLFGYSVTIIGIIMSGMGIKSNKKTFAIIGLILSIIFLIVTLINSILGAVIAVKGLNL